MSKTIAAGMDCGLVPGCAYAGIPGHRLHYLPHDQAELLAMGTLPPDFSPVEAVRNELAAIRLFLGLRDDETIIGRLREWKAREERVSALEGIVLRSMQAQRQVETEGRAIETAIAERAVDERRGK